MTSRQNVRILCRVYHFNYVARLPSTTNAVGVQGQQYRGGAWTSTYASPLYAWDDGQENGRNVAWSTEILMAAGDRFRIVNSGTVSETFILQQLSGYFAGAAPLGAQAASGSTNVVAGQNMFTPSYTIGYESKGGCGDAVGFSGFGYIAPRPGLYQLQVRRTRCSVR